MSDWKDLRTLVVGCGSIGKRHARVLRQIGVKTLYACDPVPGQVEAAARDARFDKVADSFEAGVALAPDVVFLCTPPALHVAQTRFITLTSRTGPSRLIQSRISTR